MGTMSGLPEGLGRTRALLVKATEGSGRAGWQEPFGSYMPKGLVGAGEEAPAEAQWAPRRVRVMAEHVRV